MALRPKEIELFEMLPDVEQQHAYRVMNTIQQEGGAERDLLAAALLHDVGKVRVSLTLIERSIAVIVTSFMPGFARSIADGKASVLRRAFVVQARHPEWGAEMAEFAGSSPRTVELIRKHQEALDSVLDDGIYGQLRILQLADNMN